MAKDKDFGFMFNIVDDDLLQQDSKDIVSPNENYTSFEDISSYSNKNRRYKKKKRGIFGKFGLWWQKRKSWQKASMITAVSIILVIAIFMGVVLSIFNYNYNEITDNPEDLGFENIINKDIVNIALFGIDTRSQNSFKGNSDSIMILSLNANTKKVKIISIMRDSLVPIVNNKNKKTFSKINSAYASGGPELAIKTINSVFGLDISEYATVNFFGMAEIIDAVGGIDVELTEKEVTKNLNASAINFCIKEICEKSKLNPKDYYIYKSGVQHLNGVQAVAYARIRKVANIWGTNNDYGRTDRQRYVMEQLFNKALTLDKSKYPALAKSLIPCSETSLSYSEIIGLAFDILLHSPTFSQARIPQNEYIMPSPSTKNGSVVYYDIEYATKLIHAFIYDDITPDQYIELNGVEKNDWYRQMGGTYIKPSASTSSKDESTDSEQQTSSKDNSSNSSSNKEDKNDKDDNDSKDGKDDNSSNSSDKDSSNNQSSDNSSSNDEGSSSTNGESSDESNSNDSSSSKPDEDINDDVINPNPPASSDNTTTESQE